MKMKAQHTWNLRGTIKVLLRGKFIPLMASLEKLESPHSKNLKLHLKALVKEANAHKRSRQQETIQIRTELNQLDTKKTTKRINKIKSWFFEKINKIDKPLAKLKGREMLGPILALFWALRTNPSLAGVSVALWESLSLAWVLRPVSVTSVSGWLSKTCLALPLPSYCWCRALPLALSVTPYPPSPFPASYIILPHQKSPSLCSELI